MLNGVEHEKSFITSDPGDLRFYESKEFSDYDIQSTLVISNTDISKYHLISKKIVWTNFPFFCGISTPVWGWSGGAMVRVNFQYQGVLLIWKMVGQGPTALAECAVGAVWTFFSHLSFLSSFSLSLGGGPTETEVLSQRAVKRKTANQPSNPGISNIWYSKVNFLPISQNIFFWSQIIYYDV